MHVGILVGSHSLIHVPWFLRLLVPIPRKLFLYPRSYLIYSNSTWYSGRIPRRTTYHVALITCSILLVMANLSLFILTCFAFWQTCTAAVSPFGVTWPTNVYGPDGPWQTVEVLVGTPGQT